MLVSPGAALWEQRVVAEYGSTCAHPDRDDYAGHVGPVTLDATMTWRVTNADGAPVTEVCPGQKYAVRVTTTEFSAPVGRRKVLKAPVNLPHWYLTTSLGMWDYAAGDLFEPCVEGGSRRASVIYTDALDTSLGVPCNATGSILFKATHAERGGRFYVNQVTVPVRNWASCSANAAANDTSANTTCVDPEVIRPDPEPVVPPAVMGCSAPCACAYGVNFGRSVCGYANTTADVKHLVELLSGASPNFEDALLLYVTGENAYSDDNTVLRSMFKDVARKSFGQDSYYTAASAYFRSEFYLDSNFGDALRGTNTFSSMCCGVRTELAKAGAHWLSAAFALHKLNSGVCYLSGCNGQSYNRELSVTEVMRGLAVLTGANGVPAVPAASTSNPHTLFSATNAANKCKPGRIAVINDLTLSAAVRMAEAAGRGLEGGTADGYRSVEGTMVARFLQLSLQMGRAASLKLREKERAAAGACSQGCLRSAQMAAAAGLFKVVEPIVAAKNPELPKPASAVFARADPEKSYKQLFAAYKAIMAAFDMSPKLLKAKCIKEKVYTP
ncbi:MAG: hypothetical protein J3K34DRAFT_502559 [Monoraphidium minutum]|nr:MAG: hypothetical protein J3K34DRAFT_502559 [Monoraphidium minutum]